MKKKVSTSIFVLIVLFFIFNAFDCVEIWHRNWFADEVNFMPAGALIKIGAVNNLFPVALIIGVVQLIATIIDSKTSHAIGIFSAIIGAVFSLRIPFYAILGEELFAMIGGRGNDEYIATFFGYAVVIIAFSLVIMQIILYCFAKRNPQGQTILQ